MHNDQLINNFLFDSPARSFLRFSRLVRIHFYLFMAARQWHSLSTRRRFFSSPSLSISMLEKERRSMCPAFTFGVLFLLRRRYIFGADSPSPSKKKREKEREKETLSDLFVWVGRERTRGKNEKKRKTCVADLTIEQQQYSSEVAVYLRMREHFLLSSFSSLFTE